MGKIKKLVVIKGDIAEKEFLLVTNLKIGREADNDVVINDERVSRHHATVEQKGPFCYLENFSANGTYLNNSLIEEPARLRHGDTISIADVATLRYTISNDRDQESMKATIRVMPKLTK